MQKTKSYLKLSMVFLVLALGLAVLIMESWSLNFIIKHSLGKYTAGDIGFESFYGKGHPVGYTNPDLAKLIPSLFIAVFSIIGALFIIRSIFKNKDLSMIKYIFIPLVTIVIAFLIPYFAQAKIWYDQQGFLARETHIPEQIKFFTAFIRSFRTFSITFAVFASFIVINKLSLITINIIEERKLALS